MSAKRRFERRTESPTPFTYMWTNLRARRTLNAAYAAQKRVPEGEPDRSWRRDFVRSELRRLRPLRPQTRLTFKQLWRLSLTAAE